MDLGTCYYADVWDIDPYAELVKYTGDEIIFHGTEDSVVDISYSRELVKHYASAMLVEIDGADHGFWGDDARSVADQTVEFVQAH